jgi:nitrite reductase/ring-hydroxylating ferredoxin subunit
MTTNLFRVCKKSEVPDDGGREAFVKDRVIAVFGVEGEFCAIDDTCSHMEASLAQGFIEGCEIECPRHGGRFDIRTGEATASPCTQPVRAYPVRVIDDEIYVEIRDDDARN